jgi:hypothetical protein
MKYFFLRSSSQILRHSILSLLSHVAQTSKKLVVIVSWQSSIHLFFAR